MNRLIGVLRGFKNIKVFYPLFLGLFLGSILLKDRATASLFWSDVAFLIAVLYIITGFFQLAHNMGAFTSTKFAFRSVPSLFSRKRVSTPSNMDQYVDYARKQAKYENYVSLLIMGFTMFVISVLVSLVARKS